MKTYITPLQATTLSFTLKETPKYKEVESTCSFIEHSEMDNFTFCEENLQNVLLGNLGDLLSKLKEIRACHYGFCLLVKVTPTDAVRHCSQCGKDAKTPIYIVQCTCIQQLTFMIC